MEKTIPMITLWCHHSVIVTDFLMPATQQHIIHVHVIIVIILIIYSFYFLTFLENYIDNIVYRNKCQQEQLLDYKRVSSCWSELKFTIYYTPHPLINWDQHSWCNFLNTNYNAYAIWLYMYMYTVGINNNSTP